MENIKYKGFDIVFRESESHDIFYDINLFYEVKNCEIIFRKISVTDEISVNYAVDILKDFIDNLYELKTYEDVLALIQYECINENGVLDVEISKFILYFYFEILKPKNLSKVIDEDIF